MAQKYFVTAIGTDSGKTLISAIITQALHAEYWKPIQSGIEIRDTESIRKLVSFEVICHPEAYLLKAPMSPHAAASLEDITIELEKIKPPNHRRDLVIEGAGGILVPINEYQFIADLIEQIDCETILISDLYLGSINHTLLTINELKRRKINVKGIIFNGEANIESMNYILKYSGYRQLLHVKKEEYITSETIERYADALRKEFSLN